MRLHLLVGATLVLGLAGVTFACSSETTIIPGEEDGGTSSSGGSSGGSSSGSSGDPDGGTSSSGGLTSTELKAGNIVAVGVSLDDVIFVLDTAGARSIEAVPIAGGASTKIADLATGAAADRFAIRGGAVAIWKTIANSQGTISIWSRAAGLKADVATNSTVGLFFASTDGTRIAFSVASTPAGANPTSTSLAVSDLGAAAVSATPVLTGAVANAGPAINLAAAVAQGMTPAACPLDIGFVGTRLFAAYCTGVVATTNTARLVTVPAGAPTPDRLDAANAGAATIRPSWFADTAGTKVFVMTAAGQGRIISNAGVIQNLVNNTEEGFMTPDGAAALYRTTAGAVEKHTGAGAAVSLVANGAMGLLGQSADGKRVLYYTQVDAQTDLIDARGVDHTVAPVVVTYSATPTIGPIGFNGASSDFVYLDEIAMTGFKLKSKPAAGGTEKVITDGVVSAELVRTGTGAIVYKNPNPQALQQGIIIGDISFVDTAVAMSPPQAVALQIPEPLVRLKDKNVIYAKPMMGLHKTTLP